jgi:ribosomal protein S18 acetylase RimI-like enzyme
MVNLIPAQENMEEFLALVKEYTERITLQDAEVAKTLSSQHLAEELKDTERKYGFPYGRMYLSLVDGSAAGCVALTRNDDQYCEMKRLYVKPEFRGMHLSRLLCDQVIDDAKAIGYRYMRLDTFPFMESAIRLYKSYGFYSIPRYNANPASNAIFLQLTL